MTITQTASVILCFAWACFNQWRITRRLIELEYRVARIGLERMHGVGETR
jgi:hypothetical protein